MLKYCQICLWNESNLVFDDEEYSNPPYNSELYRIKLLNGYNWVINSKCYNKISVCNECLLDSVYGCDLEQKSIFLKELKIYTCLFDIVKKKNIPHDLLKYIHKFLI